MSRPTIRTELLERARTEFDQLLEAVVSIEPQRRAGPSGYPRGSVKDMLAHLAGWDDTNRRAVGEIMEGRKPSFWQHYDKDCATYNARLVAEYGRDDFGELLALVRETHRGLIEYLQSVPAKNYYGRSKIRTLLRTEIQDCREHARQVEQFFGSVTP